MNKKMKVIQRAIQDKFAQARRAQDKDRSEGATKLMGEYDALQEDFELERRFYEWERAMVPDELEGDDPGDPGTRKKISGFAVIAELPHRQPLSDEERVAITPEPGLQKTLVMSTNAADGEASLMPKDADTKIRELRRNYISAKDLVMVIPTTSLFSSSDFESGAVAGLKDFDDGSDIPDGTDPTFKTVKFVIALKGMIIPVSSILTVMETAGLIACLNNWFVKNAVYSGNKDIFAALKASKSTKKLASLGALDESLNLDLDPACLTGGVIVANQTGWNVMDKIKDANGHPMLQSDPASATQELFKSLPIHVFSDTQLFNESIKTLIFYGDFKAGCHFVEFAYQSFDASAHAGFVKNRTLVQAIEGYGMIQADVDAYCCDLLDPAVASAPTADVGVKGTVTTKIEVAG